MEPTDKKEANVFTEQVGEKEKRKLKALGEKKENAMLGLGMIGMVGWSVVVPSLLGAALGIRLDKNYPEPFSWTLTCLVAGLFTGCMIAWYWVDKEDKRMHKNKKR